MGLFRNTGTPLLGGPLTEKELRKFLQEGAKFDFLKYYSVGMVHQFDDFLGDAINLDLYASTAGATATAYASTADRDGMIRGVHGTTAATSGLLLQTPAMWYGDYYCGVEVCFRLSVITEQRIEIGFGNAVPAANTTVVNSLATPTFNTLANGVVYVYDHAGSTTTSGFYSDGTSSTAAAAKTATTTNRPVADTWQTVRIQTFGSNNSAALWVDGKRLVNTGGVLHEGGTANVFFISATRSDTTDCNLDIDYIRLWQERSSRPL